MQMGQKYSCQKLNNEAYKMDFKSVLEWVFKALALGGTIYGIKKIVIWTAKNSSKSKNGDAITQDITVKTESGSSSQIAVGGRDSFSCGRDQYNNCSITSMPSLTDKESAATAIKQAICHFFSSILGNITKEGTREGGLLDPRNLFSGRLKPSMLWHTIERFQKHRKVLQESRKTHAPQLSEVDQTTLRELFNNLVGADERAINDVSEDDIHTITEAIEKEFIEASNKALHKYLGI
jgi:hypothetical protein